MGDGRWDDERSTYRIELSNRKIESIIDDPMSMRDEAMPMSDERWEMSMSDDR
jgi:hypothetical protein